MTTDELFAEYHRLAHAMQAGVAVEEGARDQTPKHLRVGINTAMSDHGALVKLLIDKGLFNEHEYAQKLVEFMQHEVDLITERIQARAGGAKVTLV